MLQEGKGKRHSSVKMHERFRYLVSSLTITANRARSNNALHAEAKSKKALASSQQTNVAGMDVLNPALISINTSEKVRRPDVHYLMERRSEVTPRIF